MIPDSYWQIARRWFKLIALITVVCIATAPWVLPPLIGASSSDDAFSSTGTLVVSHFVSPSGLVEPGGGELDDEPVAGYTTSLALYAGTEQYLAEVQMELAEQQIILGRRTIDGRLEVVANPPLFRLELAASAATREEAQALVRSASTALIAHADNEALRATMTIIAILEEEQQVYVDRLEVLETPPVSTALLVDVELQVIRAELKDITWEKEVLLFNRNAPVSMTSGPNTVLTEASTIPMQNLLLLGAGLGLVLGWIGANIAEHFASSPAGARTPATVRLGDVTERLRIDPQLRRLTVRAGEIERRARALEGGSAHLIGEPPADSS